MAFLSYIPSVTLPSQFFTSPTIAILVPIALGLAVGYGTRPRDTKRIYATIRQPPLRPPAWVFGPVWTILYGTMGYAAYHATTTGLFHPNPEIRSLALIGTTAYTSQLGLNLAWMPLFFGLRKPGLALADIVALTVNVGSLAMLWAKWDPTAAYLMVPYLAWLSFATYITAGVGVLNNWDISKLEGKRN